jgi:hypothetical protein
VCVPLPLFVGYDNYEGWLAGAHSSSTTFPTSNSKDISIEKEKKIEREINNEEETIDDDEQQPRQQQETEEKSTLKSTTTTTTTTTKKPKREKAAERRRSPKKSKQKKESLQFPFSVNAILPTIVITAYYDTFSIVPVLLISSYNTQSYSTIFILDQKNSLKIRESESE